VWLAGDDNFMRALKGHFDMLTRAGYKPRAVMARADEIEPKFKDYPTDYSFPVRADSPGL
jgi:hypothetical protein